MVDDPASSSTGNDSFGNDTPSPFVQPQITPPTGGGAIRGIGEKFAANPVTGTGSLTIPIAASPGRSGFGPQLSLSYDSGTGNGHFGMGWSPSLLAITRKIDKDLPQYRHDEESDVFILTSAEDLVPVLHRDRRGNLIFDECERNCQTVKRHRSRSENSRQQGRSKWITPKLRTEGANRHGAGNEPSCNHPTGWGECFDCLGSAVLG